jgi:hypothetical protein
MIDWKEYGRACFNLQTLEVTRHLYFCPHNVVTSFVWISQQTAIISLRSKTSVFITETEYVYCAVRTEPSLILLVIRRL